MGFDTFDTNQILYLQVLESLFTSVEKNTLAFMSVYYGLPKSQGNSVLAY